MGEPTKMKKSMVKLIPVLDVVLVPLVYVAAWLLKTLRRIGFQRLPNSKNVLLRVGVFPIRDHYYEPQFDFRDIAQSLSQDRPLPGVDWNRAEQLERLASFSFAEELSHVPITRPDTLDFYLDNGAFEAGELW